MTARHAVLADLLVAFHFCYVALTIGAEILILLSALLRWGWVRTLALRIVHLASGASAAR